MDDALIKSSSLIGLEIRERINAWGRLQFLKEARQLLRHDTPHDGIFDVLVSMNQNISESYDGRPISDQS